MRRVGRTGAALVAASVVFHLPVSVTPAMGQELTWSGSFDVATGDYFFDESTTSIYLQNGLGLQWDQFSIDISLPLVLQNNAVVTRVGGMPIPTGGDQRGDLRGRGGPTSLIELESASSYEFTVADPLISAGFDIDAGDRLLRTVHLGLSAKPPISDVDSGVGTGEWDFGASAGALLAAGRLLILFDATYWSFGDLPDLELKDAVAYGAAVGSAIGKSRFGWSMSLLGSTEIIEGIDPPVSLGGSLYLTSVSRRNLSLGLRFGLTESAADVSVSVGWGVPLLNTIR